MHHAIRRLTGPFLAAILAPLLLLACTRAPVAPPPAPAPAPIPLDLSHAVVIGASVSDGFGAMLPGQSPKGLLPIGVGLSRSLGAIAHTHPAPAGFTSSMFFLKPDPTAKGQIEAAAAAEPDLVIALDFLFWHLYGNQPEDQRLAHFDKGLERLASLNTALIVADIPDETHAIGTMLMASQVPKPDTIAKANQRLAAWASSRPNVVIVPLKDVVAQAIAKGSLTLGGHAFTGDAARALLSDDGLHATLRGQVLFALEALARARDARMFPPQTTWDTDPDAVIRRLSEAAPDKAP